MSPLLAILTASIPAEERLLLLLQLELARLGKTKPRVIRGGNPGPGPDQRGGLDVALPIAGSDRLDSP